MVEFLCYSSFFFAFLAFYEKFGFSLGVATLVLYPSHQCNVMGVVSKEELDLELRIALVLFH